MNNFAAKIINQAIAQALADKFPDSIQVFKNGSDYYTWVDIAQNNLLATEYNLNSLSQSVVDGTSPLAPIRKIFPR